ncbi:MAG: hypothetical protein SVY53_05325 [Chloroflexota bacterium]|nr:hypothetical protein [Chloroflexota bacterium]
MRIGGLKRHVGSENNGEVKVGCILNLPLRYLDGEQFMSKDVYGFTGTIYNTNWQLDGIEFNGSNAYVDFSTDTRLAVAKSFTLGGKVKQHTTSSEMQFFGRGYGLAGIGNNGYALTFRDPNRQYLDIYDEATGYRHAYWNTITATTEWNYTIGFYDFYNSTYGGWRYGLQKHQIYGAYPVEAGEPNIPFVLGRRGNIASYYFDGVMASCRLHLGCEEYFKKVDRRRFEWL